MKNKLFNSFLDCKCPVHGCKLQLLEAGLFCSKIYPDQIVCGMWDLKRVERLLVPSLVPFISSLYLRELSELKEYFNEQK